MLRMQDLFFNWKNMAGLRELILQIVMYFHAGSHANPQRVKMCMQMRAGRKEHKNNEHGYSGTFALTLDTN